METLLWPLLNIYEKEVNACAFSYFVFFVFAIDL